MVFVQSYRLGDLGGDVVWELAITPNYQELFDSTDKREIDIIDFGDVKFEGDASDLSQKEDEFDFTLFESRAKTDDDILAINLLKSAEYSDVWVALFEYEPTRIEDFAKNQCDFKNRIFSGLIRRKITGNDNIWYGEAWDSNPRPIREWKFSAQALGEALLDSVKLASSFDENGKLIPGALALAQISPVDLGLITQNTNGGTGLKYKGAVRLSDAILALLTVAQSKISEKIPGFTITAKPSKSGYTFAYTFNFIGDLVEYSESLRLELFGDAEKDAYIDSRLIKYPTEENDGVTVKYGFGMAWHRFANLTDLLYKLALSLGCRLRISHTGKSGFEITFEPIIGVNLEKISIFDATKASIDLQEASISSSDKYYCQGTDFNNEGYSYSWIENGEIASHDEIKSKKDPLPLSISLVMQKISRKDMVGVYYQNSSDGYLTTKECAWTGILLPTSDVENKDYFIATAVATTIENKAIWYKTLADCLNSKVSANNTYYKSEYSIELPYIKSFQSSRVAASLANLALFKSIEIDGKTYCINSITIKPSDGIVSIKAANSDKYGFAQPPEPPIYGKIAPPEITQDDYIEESRVDSFVAFSSVKKNDYLMLLGNLLVAKFRLGSEPAWERAIGVAQNDALKGQVVYVKNTGFVEIENAAFDNAGRAIYLRAGDSGNFYSTDRALKRIQGKEVIDLKVGIAVSATKFRLTEPEAYILM